MSTITFVLLVFVLLLALALYACYKTNQPLRKKAKAEAEAKMQAKLDEEARGREKGRRETQRKEMFSDLEAFLQNPDMWRGEGRHPMALRELVHQLRSLKDNTEVINRLEKRLSSQERHLRANELLMWDIQKALQLGEPVVDL